MLPLFSVRDVLMDGGVTTSSVIRSGSPCREMSSASTSKPPSEKGWYDLFLL